MAGLFRLMTTIASVLASFDTFWACQHCHYAIGSGMISDGLLVAA